MRAAAVLAVLLMAAPAEATCRLALALGLDVSGSVDRREYRLQLDGLAAALQSADVQQALFAMPGTPVWLTIYEWGSAGQQVVLVDGVAVTGPDVTARIARTLRARQRQFADPGTAIGAAMTFGADLVGQRPECWRMVIDISGDGPSNDGTLPDRIALPQEVTVNGLVVAPQSRANIDKDLSRVETLTAYYAGKVIRGPGAFVEEAADYRDFERAMTRKLIREIALPRLGRAAMPPQGALP